MDKKNTKAKSKRVSMTDLIGATGATPPRTKAAPARAIAGRHVDPSDPVISVSVTLRTSEFNTLQTYADKHSATRGSLITALMRHAMKDLRAGRVALKVESLKFVDSE